MSATQDAATPAHQLPLHYAELESLYASIGSSKARSVALCSSNGQTGVTLLAIALAHRAASEGRKVLLVDLNQAHPALHSHFDQPCYCWRLLDSSWQQAVINRPDGVDLLCASTDQDDPDFHSAARLAEGIQQLTQHYELVIMDTSPLARRNRHNTPPELVCCSADVSILCILTGVCTESQLIDSCERLRSVKARLLGVVMNDRFAPGLLPELLREVRRIEKRFPRLARKLRQRLERSLLLQQQL
ncbi:MAG: hypothetical protein OIF57_13175 [Marinobacterium sp.]|nr:hypothetical protein [Marinobacterium sp.]